MSSLVSIIILTLVLAACSSQPTIIVAPIKNTLAKKTQDSKATVEKVIPARGITTRCVREGEYRTLRIINLQPHGCRLWYSNFSEAKPVAWATTHIQHCENVRDQIIKSLGKVNFKCVQDDEKSVTFL